MRITLFIDTLGVGGAQRVLTLLANRWAEQGHDVCVWTLSAPTDDVHETAPGVRRETIGLLDPARSPAEAVLRNAVRTRRIRQALRREQPDIAISFMRRMNVLVLAASLGSNVPVIVSERANPLKRDSNSLLDAGMRLLARRAAAIVLQTQRAAAELFQFVPPHLLQVIPNPVELPDPAAHTQRASNTIVGAGRLVHEKGFDLLIQAFASLDAPTWSLVIHGEGPEREALTDLAASFGIEARTALPGSYAAPETVLRGADIFCLSSRHEGFPNVLLEAMALGRPVVATDCPYGPGEIIRDSVDGLLVAPAGEPDALAARLQQLIDDPGLRASLGKAANERAGEFGLESVGTRWDALVERITR